MTTRRAPDYHLELDLSLKEFQALCGTAFAVNVFLDKKRTVQGELTIPEFNDFPELCKRVKAWLWLGKPARMGPGTEVTIVLREPSEYANH